LLQITRGAYIGIINSNEKDYVIKVPTVEIQEIESYFSSYPLQSPKDPRVTTQNFFHKDFSENFSALGKVKKYGQK